MAIFNNFPYVDTHELNLDYLIKKMKELEDEWRAMTNSVTASATRGNEAGVIVDGNMKDGLSFTFTLPADILATTSNAGEVQPDGNTIKINSSGIISSQLQGVVARVESGTNALEADTFTKINLNGRILTFGEGALFSLTQGGVRVNRGGTYLIEGSSWAMATDPTNASSIQLRVLKGASYETASALGWGITNAIVDDPVNTAMRVVNLNEGDIIFMDIAITGSDGLFKYSNNETQLTILKVA